MARETIASMAVRLGIDLTDFQKDMQEFQKTWGKLGQQLQQVGTQIGVAFTAAGGAIAAGLGLAVNKAMDFDAQMSRVGAIAGATGQDLEALRQTALDLGASTSKSATEVAVGMELMAAKGYEASQVIAAMPGVIAAAEASGEDMALVADTVASALNAFQMEASYASKVADILAKSANTSAAGVQDLQYAFKYAAPVANALGISIEQLAAATGIMADNGMKGEQAGTTLRAALLRLTDPPKEAKKALDALGVSVTDASRKFLPFDQIIAQLATSTANMTDAQKAQALSTIFGTEAMTGMLSLIEAGPEKFRTLTAELLNSEGASATAAAAMKDNLAGSMEELSGAVETLQISLGSALSPAIRAVADALTGVVNLFNALPEPVKNMIAMGAALVAGLMILVGVVGFLTAGLGALAAAQWAVILPIAGWVAAVAAAVAALVGLVAAVVYAYRENETFRNIVQQTWTAVVNAIKAAWAFIHPAIQAIASYFVQKFSEVLAFWNQVWPQMQQALMNIWNGIWAFLQPMINGIVQLMQWAWPFVKMIIVGTWEAIQNLINGALNVIMGILKAFASLFTGDWKGLWEGVKQIISGALEMIWGWFQLWGAGRILKFAGFLGGQIAKVFKSMWDETAAIFKAGGQWIWDIVSSRMNAVLDFLKGLGSMFYNAGKGLIEMMKAGIENAANAVIARVQSLAQSIRNMLPFSPAKEGPLSDLDKLDFAGPITDSIFRGMPVVQASMSQLLKIPEPVMGGGYGADSQPVTPAPGGGSTIIIFELDGRAIAKKTFEHMGGTLRLRGAVT